MRKHLYKSNDGSKQVLKLLHQKWQQKCLVFSGSYIFDTLCMEGEGKVFSTTLVFEALIYIRMLGRTYAKIISPFLIFQTWCFIYQKKSLDWIKDVALCTLHICSIRFHRHVDSNFMCSNYKMKIRVTLASVLNAIFSFELNLRAIHSKQTCHI